MESILTIVLLVILYSGVYTIKALVGKGRDDGPMANEAFPEVEYYEPEEPAVQQAEPVQQPVPANNRAPVAERRRPRSRSRNEATRSTAAPEPAQPSVEESRSRRFSLKDKTDAQRAVIYSEILNRKYD